MASLRMNAFQRLEAIRRRAADLQLLQEIYAALYPADYVPDNKQFELWLIKYDRDLIAEAFEIGEVWFRRLNEAIEKLKSEGRGVPKEMYRDRTEVIKYISAILKRKSSDPTQESTSTKLEGDDEELIEPC